MKKKDWFGAGKKQLRNAKSGFLRPRTVLIAAALILLVAAVALSVRYLVQTTQQKALQAEMRAQLAAASPDMTAVVSSNTPAAVSPEMAAVASPDMSTAVSPDIPLVASRDITPLNSPSPAAAMDAATPAATGDIMATPLPAMAERFVGLYSRNKDLAGWLTSQCVPDIDFAVVQRDNTYYLNRDFYRRENQGGTVFVDENGRISPRDDNLILHGHNMKNGTMFGKLYYYLDAAFIAAQPVFEFSTLYESGTYIPYAVSLVSSDPSATRYAQLLTFHFDSPETLASYTGRLIELSQLVLPVAIQPGDRLLTLVTCHGDEASERLVVALREVRPGEDLEALKLRIAQETRKAPQPTL